MSIKERQKYIRRFCKFKSVYIESFGHSPSSYIWPELTLGSSDEEEFILINIFKTLFLKIFITLSRIKKNKNPSLLELNDFKSIQKNKKSFWKSITNIFRGGTKDKNQNLNSIKSKIKVIENSSRKLFKNDENQIESINEETKLNHVHEEIKSMTISNE